MSSFSVFVVDLFGLAFGVASSRKEGRPPPLPPIFFGDDPGETEEVSSLAFTLPNRLASICSFISDLVGETSAEAFFMGFTLGEAVLTVPPEAEVDVAEVKLDPVELGVFMDDLTGLSVTPEALGSLCPLLWLPQELPKNSDPDFGFHSLGTRAL